MAAKGAVRGVYPMLYAFFGPDGALDRAAMRAQVEYCVASGAHGVAALGLGTEVSKLSADERLSVMAWAVEDLARSPAARDDGVRRDAEEQIAFVEAAAARGADWVILQPPQPAEGRRRSARISS